MPVRTVLSEDNQLRQSHCVVKSDGLAVEIFEQSADVERRLTKATLACLEMELQPLVTSPDTSTILRALPPDSIRRGLPSLELRGSGGIYNAALWVHVNEPGRVYLKAFEVSRNTLLSCDRLKENSNEWIGWSDDPADLFFSDTHITIYEGDWGKPYAARFEVWFLPDSGQPERKLLEKVFKIEGWQR